MINHVAAYRKQLQHTGELPTADGGGLLELSAAGRGRLGISVEVEKTRPDLAALVPLADVVGVSDYTWSVFLFLYNTHTHKTCTHTQLKAQSMGISLFDMQLLVSKEYAQYQGYHSMEEAVIQFRSKTKKE